MKPLAKVVRLGALGDAVIMQPLLKILKDDGYRVHLHASHSVQRILRHDPNIERLIIWEEFETYDETVAEWDRLKGECDLFINLSGGLEDALLIIEDKPNYNWSHDKRHKECNVNYYDFMMAISGYKGKEYIKSKLYFTRKEHRDVQKMLRKHRDKYIILWSLSGSAYHKVYPYTELVAVEFLERHRDSVIITVGDTACTVLEWEHPRTICKSDKLDIRLAMLMTNYVDLVIGTETGILNAAECYDTPKIMMLSHSSVENLTKYWQNTTSLHADVPCYPCHQIHFTKESCKLGGSGAPICMDKIEPESLLKSMETIYYKSLSRVA